MKANIMPNKHTPGPWAATKNGNITSADRKVLIATLSGINDEDESNARLIAAAPDLLEALQACLLRDDIASDELGGVIRSAIAKAL